MRRLLAGVDIGGTKCAVVVGAATADEVLFLGKRSFPTPSDPRTAIGALSEALAELLAEHADAEGTGGALQAIGISCGGPLDSARGRVLSPPNLPGWDDIDVVGPFRERFGVPVALQNDANACALAEWRWGAGKGAQHMVFLTFGTGMGAGLILNGKLYAGANDMAGEVGHVRLAEDGPRGYGKAGSFEGFCSGGGIARLAEDMIEDWRKLGRETLLGAPAADGAPVEITARHVAEAALAGDELAAVVIRLVGQQLGRGLAMLVDVLNPERIVIGSIYARQERLLAPIVLEELRREALPNALAACRILPSALREQVGDAAGLSVAMHALEQAGEAAISDRI
ncbi:ROK family protein [Cohnella sp. REN36]|uniref:ROK family protein n=1 Tax=Cohnella sp. REN36 TaxID=2887347 RepID=UPI001D1448F6|nr:ROK family protein [Cohnella sp. REN36]MCC3376423.1 ROK family protein [Cohnella sp. REN36]